MITVNNLIVYRDMTGNMTPHIVCVARPAPTRFTIENQLEKLEAAKAA